MFFYYNPCWTWSSLGQYSALNSFEFLLSSPPVSSCLAVGQPPHPDPLSMSILIALLQFYLQILSFLEPRYMHTCYTGDRFKWRSHRITLSLQWLEKALSYLAPHALGWTPSQDALQPLKKIHWPRATHPSSTDMSGFHLRLVSSYVIISCYINNHGLLYKQYPQPPVLCKYTVLQTFDGWLIIIYWLSGSFSQT